ncbi:cysteine hydrolase family protein [Flavobacterium sp. UW10123]|uniref:cysteine hydrolase family protein n=1 Tax=Flavobacterium sp. UW10123 TaxID=3230800 RepID=UPI00339174E1
MSISKLNNPALILIDIQKGFHDVAYWGGDRNNVTAEEKAGELLELWRTKKLPIFHVQHCSSNPNSILNETNPGNEFQDVVKPLEGEIIIKKNVNSAFIGTNLKELIDNAEITNLVIVGLTTDHCVSTTTRMAGNFGYNVFLVSNAAATFNKKGINGENFSAEIIHQTALASLNEEFAQVVDSEFIKEII